MKKLNVEIKARCQDQEKVRTYLKSHGANLMGMDHQIDTYFRANSGRLKLREGNIENRLVHYNRVDQAGPKQSHVTLFENPPGSSLKVLLTHALGVLVVVDKKREIYFIDNVKFHVDRVEDLGSFVEIEAIGKEGELEKLDQQCRHYLDELEIRPEDLLKNSYSDLLLALQ